MICEIDFPDVDGGRWRARFSHSHRVLIAHKLGDVEQVIAQAEQAALDGQWVVGFVSYEAAAAFDAALQTHAAHSNLPLAAFAVYGYDEAALEDISARSAISAAWALLDSEAIIAGNIDAARAAIDRGDYYQVNYATRLQATLDCDIAALYAALRAAQPNGYCACIDGGDWQIASVSPELFFDWTPNRTLTTKPMKGTAALDAAAVLSDSAKERAENLMIVDLLRNDMARVAETGSVQVVSLFDIEALPSVLQMTSTIRCVTKVETTLPDIFRALFPCGSVTGAPKVAAMQAIKSLETSPRGIYCGAIGVIRPGGHATFNVAIRSVQVDAKNKIALCGIGSGITSDSNARDEFAEWLVKRRFLLRATASFELIETLRLESGAYWLLAGHMQRLLRSAEYFGFACDPDAVQQALNQHASKNPRGAWRVRLQLARDGKVTIESFTLEPNPGVVKVSLAQSAVDSGSEFLRHKTTDRSLYAPHLPMVDGVFDTLLFNEHDEITEFTRGNVIVELDGLRVTPPLSCGLLPGVMRAAKLASGEISEAVVLRSDLPRVSGLWFVNSVRGRIPARLHEC